MILILITLLFLQSKEVRPSVYGSPQAAGGALGAGIFALIPRPTMSFCPKILDWSRGV